MLGDARPILEVHEYELAHGVLVEVHIPLPVVAVQNGEVTTHADDVLAVHVHGCVGHLHRVGPVDSPVVCGLAPPRKDAVLSLLDAEYLAGQLRSVLDGAQAHDGQIREVLVVVLRGKELLRGPFFGVLGGLLHVLAQVVAGEVLRELQYVRFAVVEVLGVVGAVRRTGRSRRECGRHLQGGEEL